jgi:histidinol phosphatase-like PHP family hydrolase
LRQDYADLISLTGGEAFTARVSRNTGCSASTMVRWSSLLSGFDLCVASVHSHLTQPAEAMTGRLVQARETPVAHPQAPDHRAARHPTAGSGRPDMTVPASLSTVATMAPSA